MHEPCKSHFEIMVIATGVSPLSVILKIHYSIKTALSIHVFVFVWRR